MFNEAHWSPSVLDSLYALGQTIFLEPSSCYIIVALNSTNPLSLPLFNSAHLTSKVFSIFFGMFASLKMSL